MNILYYVGLAILVTAGLILVFSHDTGSAFGVDLNVISGVAMGAALLVLIGPGLLFRQDISTTFKSIAIWVLIFLGIATVYTYQVPLERAAHRAGVIIGLADPIDANSQNAITIYKTAGGHYEVDGYINNAPMTFLVDTGASSTTITAEDAKRAGFDIDNLIYNVPFMTANGRTFASEVKVNSFAIAGLSRDQKTIYIAQPGNLTSNLLGMEFLQSLSSFKFEANQLVLTP